MELKEIVGKAKEHLGSLFSDRISSGFINLEEVEPLENDKWKITLSFYETRVDKGGISFAQLQGDLRKVYKILYVGKDGKLEKIKNYEY